MKPELLQRDFTHTPHIKECGRIRREHREDTYGQTCHLHCGCGISSSWHQDWEKARIGLSQNHADPWYGIPSKDIPEDGVLKVRKTDTGAIYKLSRKERGWYLSANDGIVPSGQTVYGQLRRILDEFGLEIVNE